MKTKEINYEDIFMTRVIPVICVLALLYAFFKYLPREVIV